jgi:hypothetical protein
MMLNQGKPRRDCLRRFSGQYTLEKDPGLSFRGVIRLLSDAEESVIG